MINRWSLFVVIAAAVLSADGQKYTAVVTKRGAIPALSYANPVGQGHSPCKYTFNPGWVPIIDPNEKSTYMLLRVSECPAEFGGNSDHMIMATCYVDGHCDDITKPLVLPFELYAQDPRVFYWQGFVYVFYYANGKNQDTVYLRKSSTPGNVTSWVKVAGPLPWHRNGCVILRDELPNYVLFGEAPPLPGAGIASTVDFENYVVLNDSVFRALGEKDALAPEIGIEAATPLVKLSTGDYFHVYAAATPGWVANGNYTCGFIILDKEDPTKVKQRSTTHFFSPILDYENGSGKYPVQRNRTLFPTSLVPTGNKDEFRIWYGAADANVGSALIQVTYTD